ncbi:MAG: triose-phosphate isomerase [Actinobacteria bacterium]|nr:triose-phosphate isomerase [Actinomycetota bacterium]
MEKARERIPVVAANWKMNKTCAETVNFLSQFLYMVEDVNAQVEVLVFPPFTALRSATTFLQAEKPRKIFPEIGAQNMHWEDSGAFTGEISPLMLKELGIHHVIIGHSERRNLFKEDENSILKKVEAAIRHQMTPIICVGEKFQEREEGLTEEVVKNQLLSILQLFKKTEFTDFMIAYEPVWAIGTGVAASPEDASDVCRYIRALIGSIISPDVAAKVRILYGGSVDVKNFRDFILEPDIDGGLVGTSSLDLKKFVELVKIAGNYG